MRLAVLGSAGSYSRPTFPGSGYLIQTSATNIWCDAGPGTWANLGLFLEPEQVSAVVISHRHIDHCLDALAAYAYWAYSDRPRTEIGLYAPAQTIDALATMVGGTEQLQQVFSPQPVADQDQLQLWDLSVRFYTTHHPVDTVASRWTDGQKTLAYSADTGPKGIWTEVAHEADYFLCEAAFQSDTQPITDFHLRADQAGEIARTQRVKQLLLTHIPTHLPAERSLLEAEQAFGGPVKLAVPGTSHQL